jgi:UMF1 family MFS transporter
VKLSSLYPLRGLPQQGQLWSWISFDVANQSFTLIINTLLFSIFFQEVVVRDAARDDFYWNLTYAASMLLVVLASPVAGAIADERAWKKRCLLGTGLLCATLTCALAAIPDGGLWIAVLIYLPANFMFSIGENFLASFLPVLVAREHFGRVSGFSWACAYVAALLLLGLTGVGMTVFALGSSPHWRPVFVFAGVWFFAFATPTLLFLREHPATAPSSRTGVWRAGFQRLAQSAREVTRFRDITTLFIASLFYGAGMSVVIMFASILAKDFGFENVKLVAFIAVITVAGVAGTLVAMAFQDRLGHRRTTLLFLSVWLFTTAGLAIFSWYRIHAADPASVPAWPLWIFGNLLGFGLGSLGSANRAFVGFLTPESRSGEFFGIWGLVFKFAAVLTIPFGFAKDAWGTPVALGVLFVFIATGFGLTLLVDEKRGVAAARAEDAARGVTPPDPAAA